MSTWAFCAGLRTGRDSCESEFAILQLLRVPVTKMSLSPADPGTGLGAGDQGGFRGLVSGHWPVLAPPSRWPPADPRSQLRVLPPSLRHKLLQT